MPPQESSKHSGSQNEADGSVKSSFSSQIGELTTSESSLPPTAPRRRRVLRVQIKNESSGRSKDLVVNIRPDLNLFESIYDHAGVKQAHVRKYSSALAKEVKDGTKVVQCCVWDEALEQPLHTFTVADLKGTSTQQLYEMVPENDLIKLLLRCVEKMDEDIAISTGLTRKPPKIEPTAGPSVVVPDSHPSLSGNGDISRCPFSGVGIDSNLLEEFRSKMASQQTAEENEEDEGDSNDGDSSAGMSGTAHGSGQNSLSPREQIEDMETPQVSQPAILSFSQLSGKPTVIPVRVTNQISQRSHDLVVSLSDDVTIYENIYDRSSLKKAHVRKWSSETVKKVKAGTARVQLAVMAFDNLATVHTYMVPELSSLSTMSFYNLLVEKGVPTNEIVNLQLQCISFSDDDDTTEATPPKPAHNVSPVPLPKTSAMTLTEEFRYHNMSPPRNGSSLTSFPMEYVTRDSSSGLSYSVSVGTSLDNEINSSLGGTGNDLTLMVNDKKALRVRISNRSTHRQKDLVVDINDSTNLYDSIYNHPQTVRAHVRKWGPSVVKDVKAGRAEIHVICWDDDSARPWRVFSVDELKETTTRELYEIVPESCDLVKLFLECVQIKSMPPPLTYSAEFPKLRIKNGKPLGTATLMRSSASESCLKRATRKRSNHMYIATELKGSQGSHASMSNESTGSVGKEFYRPLNFGSELNLSRHGQPRIPSRPRQAGRKMDIDAFLMQSRGGGRAKGLRSKSSDDLTANATWNSVPPKPLGGLRRTSVKSEGSEGSSTQKGAAPDSLAVKVNNFLALSSSDSVTSISSDTHTDSKGSVNHQAKSDRVNQFMRLVNKKRGSNVQSQEFLPASDNAAPSSNLRNARFPSIVQTKSQNENPLLSRVSSLTLADPRASLGLPVPSKNASFVGLPETKKAPADSSDGAAGHQTNDPKVSDRIDRFLRFSQPKLVNRPVLASQFATSQKPGSPSLASLREGFRHTPTTGPKSIASLHSRKSETTGTSTDMPPVTEIEVITKESIDANGGIGLSPQLVKEVFPYHVVLGPDFQIMQIGNSLAELMDQEVLLGRTISDVLMVTSPIPMFGKWDWNILDKMKDKTILFESVMGTSTDMKVKIKGTIIDLGTSPRTIMMPLLPNVKNLSELESMDLSMVDLPLHSSQREAVLLGEHSRSEVKLTNHLDQLHRELIDSMEKQIEERTDELETANQDLARANQQLAIQSARQLEHFACMSHEIRTPLNCIVGMSSLLLDDADEMDAMHADSIRMINTSGDLLKAVVDDVLDYAKLESGSFEVDIKPTNLQETLASVVHSISQKIQEKNIRLRTHFSATLPLQLETDARRLQQVLFNLLGNAGKFSKPNSVIDLSVTFMEGPFQQGSHEKMTLSPGRKIIRFSVKDYGKGIARSDWETIFQPFSQASKETQNVYGGTGLGLSITSKLVNRLGGTVSLDSELGKYTEFTVDLPFNGNIVDIELVRSKLSKTTLVLIEAPATYNYSFTNYEILPEPEPFDPNVAMVYGLDVFRCSSFDKALDEIKKRYVVGSDRHFAIIIHEKLFYMGIPDQLSDLLKPSDFALMTFGPNYAVEMTREWHFKSLLGFFPAALLETIHYNIEDQLEIVLSNDLMLSNEEEVLPLQPMKPALSETQVVEKKRGLFAALDSSSESGDEKEESMSEDLEQILGSTGRSAQSSLGASLNMLPSTKAVPGGLFTSLKPNADNDSVSRSKSDGSISSTGREPKARRSGRGTSLFSSRSTGSKNAPPPPPIGSPMFGQPNPMDGLFGSLGDSSSPKKDPLSSSHRSNLSSSVQSSGNHSNHSMTTPRPPQRSASKIKAAPKDRDLKVLYCEDNLVNQKVLSRHLNRAGVKEVTIVDNGQKGVDICAKQKFDIIFMDYEMPVMDGMDATKLIVERDPSAVVIFVTAHALEEFKSKAERVGASGFFSKPFKASDIEAVLDRIIKKKESIESSVPSAVVLPAEKIEIQPPVVESSTSLAASTSPASPVTSPKGRTSPTKTATPKRNLKLLMAEDNAVNQKVLTRVLNRAGVTDITIVENGQEAVILSRQDKFDAIFTDVEMPIMGGLEACKQIVANDPKALVIFVTAHTRAEFKPKADAVGAWDFLPKPFRLADVNSILDRLEQACGNTADSSTESEMKLSSKIETAADAKQNVGSKKKDDESVASTSASNHSRSVASKPSSASTFVDRKMKVLYAEDNLVNQKVLSRVLNRAGISDITIVDNGQKAVDVCARESFDIIFMDMQMPVLDGIAACRLIVERDPSAVVVFVTAHALDEFKWQAQKIGARSFISKPFRLEDIKKVLDELPKIPDDGTSGQALV